LAGEHDTVALEAAVELLWVFGWDRRQFDAAMPWIRLAEALAHRQSSDPNVSGLDLALGATFDAAGRHREALEYFRTAVERRERDEDDDDAMVEALLWLGRSLASDGDFAGSLSQLQRAQELAPNPAAAARVDIELGELHWKLGHYARAHEHFTRAEASTTALRGAEHASVAIPLAGLARTAWARGEPQRALDAIERILIIERTEAVGDATLVDALEIRAHILAAQKNVAGADRDIDRAVAIARRHGADHPMQAFVFFARAEVHRSQQRWDEALRYLERARELIGPSLGLPDPRRQELAVATGEIYAARGDATRAIDVLERARQALLACCSEHFRLGDAELALAQALAATGDDPTRARELAASARARLVRSGRPQP
jgi:tetratricopeptide (TPR) repeat protein